MDKPSLKITLVLFAVFAVVAGALLLPGFNERADPENGMRRNVDTYKGIGLDTDDTDADGIVDDQDRFPGDHDNDGIADSQDDDDDNDGIIDDDDFAFILNEDRKGDRIRVDLSLDADNDGVPDAYDAEEDDKRGWLPEAAIILAALLGIGGLSMFLTRYTVGGMTAVLVGFAVAVPLLLAIMTLAPISPDRPSQTDLQPFELLGGPALTIALFGGLATAIALGAILGRSDIPGYILAAAGCAVAFIVNYWILFGSGWMGGVLDNGGAIWVHAFGAFFGLGLAFTVISRGELTTPIETSRASHTMGLVGTATLWATLPIAATALSQPQSVGLTILNTILATVGGLIGSLVLSLWLRPRLEASDVSNGSLAGAVASAAFAAFTYPGMALILGFLSGLLAALSAIKLQPLLQTKARGVDVRGILSWHGVPGVAGGLGLILADFAVQSAFLQRGENFEPTLQLAAVLLTLVVAVTVGVITGYGVSLLRKKERTYTDNEEFVVE